jgi:hypothetical protein
MGIGMYLVAEFIERTGWVIRGVNDGRVQGID